MSNPFQLNNLITVLRRQRSTLLLFTLLTAGAAAITVWLMPRSYRSAALVAAANPQLADKARLFNQQIQQLYSYFGSGDDLDRLIAIADMDTLHTVLIREFNLTGYYKSSGTSRALLERDARKKLQRDLHLERTEKGQLSVAVWMKDPVLAAAVVNRLVALVEQTATHIWHNSYTEQYTKLDSALQAAKQRYQQLQDSSRAAAALSAIELKTISTELEQYQSARDVLAIAATTTAPALYVLEAAVPAAKAERPDAVMIILSAALAGFLAGLLLILGTLRETVISTES
jgi:hypothetical protein